MKIGYLGPQGTFSEEAVDFWLARQVTTNGGWQKVAFPRISDAMVAVGKSIDMAIVPIENSLEGLVNMTLDAFIHDVAAKIKGELILPITHNLFARGLIPLPEIKVVYSHPQALFQCQKFLQEFLPKAALQETSSTAQAARLISEKGGNIAALGSIALARTYNLQVLAKAIQDQDNNMTRFYIIASEDSEITPSAKTALVFSSENRPGSLYECLKIFALNKINLTKIESRPSKKNFGEYIFFVEAAGHRLEDPLRKALQELKPLVNFLNIIGSFPTA